VIVSVDGGKNWAKRAWARHGQYSWIQWSYPWKPERPGKVHTYVGRGDLALMFFWQEGRFRSEKKQMKKYRAEG